MANFISFTNPGNLLLSLLIVPVILLHFLNLRPKEYRVGSLFIWQRVMNSSGKRYSIRKLLFHLLLILQILFILFTAFTMAGPTLPWSSDSTFNRTVVLIDNSISMSFLGKDNRNRFEAAKAEARQIIRRKEPGQEIMLLAANSSVDILSRFTKSEQELLSALGTLEISEEAGNMQKVFEITSGVLNNRTEVVLISDGAFDATGTILREFGIRIFRFVDVSAPENPDNLGITDFSVKQHPFVPGRFDLSARISNFSDQTRLNALDIFIDGNELVSFQIILSPNESKTIFHNWINRRGDSIEATLREGDVFSHDDTVRWNLGNRGDINLLLYSYGNHFLSSLLAVYPGNKNDPAANADLEIIDQLEPILSENLPRIYIGRLPKELEYDEPRILQDVSVDNWEPEHPVMQNVYLQGSVFVEATVYEPKDFDRVLFSSRGGPLAFAHDDGENQYIYFSFDINSSFIGLKPAFPVLLSNSISWLLEKQKTGIESAGKNLLSESESDLRSRFSPPATEDTPLKNVPVSTKIVPWISLLLLLLLLGISELFLQVKRWQNE